MKRLGNDECWCGSHQKYKKCHQKFDERLRYSFNPDYYHNMESALFDTELLTRMFNLYPLESYVHTERECPAHRIAVEAGVAAAPGVRTSGQRRVDVFALQR